MKAETKRAAEGVIRDRALSIIDDIEAYRELQKTLDSMRSIHALLDLIESAGEVPAIDKGALKHAVSSKISARETAAARVRGSLKLIESAVYETGCTGTPFDVVPVDGGVEIKAWRDRREKQVVVPPHIDGKPVVSIGNSAFSDSDLVSIDLPYTLTEIKPGAFKFCKDLRHVAFPVGLKDIGFRAFLGTIALKKVLLPAGLSRIGEECFMLSGVSSVFIPGSLVEISDRCFKDCYWLHDVLIDEGVWGIGYGAFLGCPIELFVLPESIRSIGCPIFDEEMTPQMHIAALGWDFGFSVDDGYFEEKSIEPHYDLFTSGCVIYCRPGSVYQALYRNKPYGCECRSLEDFEIMARRLLQ